jgi:hypothetical protein
VAESVRIEIGFESGAVLGALVSPEAADALEQALGSGAEGAFQIDVEDGRYTLVLRRVVYVKRFAREARVGFGS